MKSGIYKILNKVNGKFYIGSAVNLSKCWREHQHHLNNGTHKNVHLQSAWNTYWDTSFEFIIIEVCEKEKLLGREQYWIDTTKCCDRKIGYNLNLVAGNMLGFKHSEETKLKFKNRIYTDEIKANMSKGQTGKKYSQETKDKWSKIRKGRIVSEQVRANTSKVHKGKPKSEEHKRKISETLKRKRVEELWTLGTCEPLVITLRTSELKV